MDIVAFGIDQGLANLGYSVVKIGLNETFVEEELSILTSGTIKTSSKGELGERISDIYTMITNLNSDYNTNIVGCEKLFFNPKQKTGRNKSASIMVTNMVSGVIFLFAGQCGIYAKDFSPGTVKKYVAGSGRADKKDVIESVSKICEKHKIIPKTEHEADAIAIGITTARYYINEVLPNLLNEALLLIDKAETRTISINYIKALSIVDKIPNCSKKKILQDRLEGVFKSLVEKSSQLVIKAEVRPSNKSYENALKTVNKLPDSNDKIDLLNRLSKIAEKQQVQPMSN